MYDATSNVQLFLDESTPDQVERELANLEGQARDWLASQNAAVLEGAPVRISFFTDAHYDGQAYQLPIAVDRNALRTAGCGALADAFNAEHARLYGHAEPQARVELVRLSARIVAQTPAFPDAARVAPAAASSVPRPVSTRVIRHNDLRHVASVFNRDTLAPGHRICGPAIVEQDDTTTLVLPNWTATCDDNLNLIIAPNARNL